MQSDDNEPSLSNLTIFAGKMIFFQILNLML